ncbi:polysaccharide deacetylase family protein [Actinomadura parmotrematis]|uniref:Polysaccharide deacetylase family protein n=1 Tax=Actinomadura parmotrematis TaxID=2864039 RepID=A0ABS7FRQ1_9ACTN|nr:polysaccharide deacetylase family protein [Actinomadura parmotrematis]MBW8483081.1 polysaccharide deacetylase family protein [Actinomadura parmotrematis]
MLRFGGWGARLAAGALVVAGVLAAGAGEPARPPADPGAAPVFQQAEGTAPPAPDPAAAWAKWGLKPLPAAPPPPADKPLKLPAKGPVPVFSNVPTKDKVVFVTIDDGAEKDPRFVEMLTDLKVPVTMFLTDDIIRDDYAYFSRLQALGNPIENHTLSHPVMPSLGLDGQRRQICGDQRSLKRNYGTAPRLFRPPYGSWNSLTQQAAADCGISGIVLWHESMQINDMQYDDPKRLNPGDVVLAHFRGPAQLKGRTMTQMFAALLKQIGRRGFAVASLTDYVAFPGEPAGPTPR